jgi:hypothetical protein
MPDRDWPLKFLVKIAKTQKFECKKAITRGKTEINGDFVHSTLYNIKHRANFVDF